LAYAGEKTINGTLCEGIVVSWNSVEPQRDIDQYLISLDNKSKRIVKLEYTIREMFNFLTSAAYFNDYKDYDGIILPTRMPVESNLVSEGFLHEMRIKSFRKARISPEELRPDSSLEIMGESK